MMSAEPSPARPTRQAALHRGHDPDNVRISTFWTSHLALSALAVVATSLAMSSYVSMGMLGPPASGVDFSLLAFLGVPSGQRSGPSSFLGRALSRLSLSEQTNQEQEDLPQIQYPIMAFGLPRSGSSAIHKFFQCYSQLHSSHYCCDPDFKKKAATTFTEAFSVSATSFPCPEGQTTCGDCVLRNMQNERAPFQGCGEYDVWSQFDVETSEPFAWFLPQHFALPLLQEAHPNATIILNYRGDPGTWADGVLHWHSVTTRFFHSFHLPLEASSKADQSDIKRDRKREKVSYGEILDEMNINLQRDIDETVHEHKRQLLIKAYQQHLEKVRTWIRANPQHRVVELNVDDPKAGEVLAQHFEPYKISDESKATPNDCWFFDADKLGNDWKDFSFPFPISE